MPRTPGPISLFAFASVVGAGLCSTHCWGQSFESESLEADVATGTGGVPSAGVTANTVDGTTGNATTATGLTGTSTTGAGGMGNTTTADTLSATSTTGSSLLSPSPFGENCKQLRLPADRDSFIWGMSPDDNYDFKGLGEDVLEVWQYGATSKRVLLRFEIYLNIPETWVVYAAQLELQALLVDSYGGRLNLHRMQHDWEERVVNWKVSTTDQPWSALGGDFDAEPFSGLDFTPALQGTIAVWDVTTEVQRIHAGGENYGWMLKEAGEPEQGYLLKYAFPGRNTQNAEQALPTLAIHFCD